MLRKFAKLATVAFVFISVIIAAGVVVPNPIWQGHSSTLSSDMHRVLILSNPIHTDIAIPVDGALRARFGFLRDAGLDVDIEGLRYLVFGWGGRAFYTETPTWADLKAIPVLKSMTLDRSVMHVGFAGDIPAENPDVTAVNLDRGGMDRLTAFILQSFDTDQDGPIVLPGAAYGAYDAFFEAKGYFNALAGCNTWTAAALRQAGAATGWWTPTPWLLRFSLRLHNSADVIPS